MTNNCGTPEATTHITESREDLETKARALEAHPDYRVLRRLDPASLAPREPIPADACIGAVLDTETTGRNATTDLLVELGLVTFAYNGQTGEVYGVLDTVSYLEDPGVPIPADASRVNGITDEMVAGQRVDDDVVAFAMQDVGLVLAHSAVFDRNIAERRFKDFDTKDWACTLTEVDWAGAGIGSSKLEFIASQMGFFYDAHRAVNDCLALLNVLSQPMPGDAGGTVLLQVLKASRAEQRRIWAVSAPFDAKDLLKARGYRWSDGSVPGTEKAWWTDVALEDYDNELQWLGTEVFGGRQFSVPVDALTARNRFSARRERLGRVMHDPRARAQ